MFVSRDYFPKSGRALDLGCFKGKESKELIAIGFEVDAVDLKTIPEINNPMFHFYHMDVKDFKIEPNTYDLILAYYILPFLKTRELVQKLIDGIRMGLRKDGIAIITLFGDEHEWNGKTKHFFVNKKEAEKMVGNYIDIHETKEKSKTMEGSEVFWHSWDFVIKK